MGPADLLAQIGRRGRVRRVVRARDHVRVAQPLIGFSETLTFEVVDVGLDREAAFIGVLLAMQGVGAVAGAAVAAGLARLVLFGIGVPIVLVALFTLLQRSTPAALQGRVYSAVELLVGVPRWVSIAADALLVTLVDYRLLLLAEAAVVAGAGAWLLSRADRNPTRPVSAAH